MVPRSDLLQTYTYKIRFQKPKSLNPLKANIYALIKFLVYGTGDFGKYITINNIYIYVMINGN